MPVPLDDDEIARQLQAAAAAGELRAAESWGRPLAERAGWDATPEALRMPYKVLKDAGIAPPEIAWFHERARLRAALDGAADAAERQRLQRRLADVEQALALRLEGLRRHAAL